jgi:Holliday junction resolvase
MSNVKKGHDYEREVKKMFEDDNYTVVRSASSNSTFDLIATKITRDNIYTTYLTVLMQQKVRKRPRDGERCPTCNYKRRVKK